MDLITYKALDTGPDAPEHPSRAHRALHWLCSLTPTAVVFMVGLSLGLGAVASQVTWLPMLVIFSIVWGATLLALAGVFVRWRTSLPARHRAAVA
ncbi:hypothetical protein [Kitasatospora sp. NPDC015120]|uniref:hypothetical protein n=1 Tax=Kitasatospora sp. NPDC015120 TaxID=3364023 RepID=UPI0036F4A4BE